MLTRSGQRRMLYLMAGATAPALGSYPYLLFGSDIAAVSALLLEHRVNNQRAGCDFSHHHGICRGVLWRVVARSRGQEPPVQVALAWAGRLPLWRWL